MYITGDHILMDENYIMDECGMDAPGASAHHIGGMTLTRRIAAAFGGMGHTLAAFWLPVAVMVLIYVAMEVWPFGNNSVLVLDLNGQYVYYFEAIRDFFRGEQGIIYSFERALGGEFLGIVAYYLASPFSFITALFPEGMITESLYVMLLLKCGLSGFNMCVYLHKSHPTKPLNEVIFSCLYALSAYAVVMQHNTMWFDCVLFFPLILLGIESLIKYGRYKLFVITLALAVFSNFYIGYMVCIGAAVYFFFYYFMCTKEERNPMGGRFHFPKALGRMVLFSLIAVGMAAIIIIPAYYSLTFGKTDFSDPSFAFKQKFDFLDLLTKMYPGSYDTVRPEGLPFVYSGMLTFILLPVFFFAKDITSRKKIAYGTLVMFFIFSFNGSTLDLVWHGFQRPNWLNYRYSFMLCFVMIVMAYLAFEHITTIDYRVVMGSMAAILLLLLILQKLEYENVTDLVCVWFSIAAIVGYMILLSGCNKHWLDGAVATVLCVFVLLELFCNGLASVVALNKDVSYSSRTSYRTFIDKWTPAADWVEENDTGFYREEKTAHRKSNDNFALNLRGLSTSTSTLNAKQIAFQKRMGYASKSHWSKYLGGTPVSDSLLGIKYLLANADDTLNMLWGEPVYTDEANETVVYRNEYALSLGYAVSGNITEIDPEKYDSPFEFMNELVTAMLGAEEDVELFVPYKRVSPDTDNLDISFVTEHKKYLKTNKNYAGRLTYKLTPVNDYEIFAYFPSDYPREAKLTLNGEELGGYFGSETHRIVSLGGQAEGEEIVISLTLEKDEIYIKNGADYFYYLDEEVFREVMPKLAEGNFRIAEYTDTHFEGDISVSESDGMLLLTIPYDEGWKVYIDGEAVAAYEVLDALTAVDVSPGEHTVELKYSPWCIKYGVIICLFSGALFVTVVTAEYAIRRRKTGTADTAEHRENPG